MTMTSERSSVGNTLCFLSVFFALTYSLSFFLSPPFSVLLPLSQYGLFLSLSPSLPVSFSHLNTLNLCLFLWFRSLFQSLQCFEPSLSLTFSHFLTFSTHLVLSRHRLIASKCKWISFSDRVTFCSENISSEKNCSLRILGFTIFNCCFYWPLGRFFFVCVVKRVPVHSTHACGADLSMLATTCKFEGNCLGQVQHNWGFTRKMSLRWIDHKSIWRNCTTGIFFNALCSHPCADRVQYE